MSSRLNRIRASCPASLLLAAAIVFTLAVPASAQVVDKSDDGATSTTLRGAITGATADTTITFHGDITKVTLEPSRGTIKPGGGPTGTVNIKGSDAVINLNAGQDALQKAFLAQIEALRSEDPDDYAAKLQQYLAGDVFEYLIKANLGDVNSLITITQTGAGNFTAPVIQATETSGNYGDLSGLAFKALQVNTGSGNINSGGMLGAYVDNSGLGTATAKIGNLTNVAFIGNSARVTDNSSINGGGVLGVYVGNRNLGTATAEIGQLSNVAFIGNSVSTTTGGNSSPINGGGLLGVYADNSGSGVATAEIGQLSNVTVMGNTVSASKDTLGYINGGGLFGAYAVKAGSGPATAGIGSLTEVAFIGNTVSVGHGITRSINGGGLLGAFAAIDGTASGPSTAKVDIGALSRLAFTNNAISAGYGILASINGGGILGVSATSGGPAPAIADLGNLNQVDFSGNSVSAGDGTLGSVIGGGLLGVSALGGGGGTATAILGSLTDVTFTGNSVFASRQNGDASIYGGGLLGASATNNGAAAIGNLSRVALTDNQVATVGHIYGGGVIGACGQRGTATIGQMTSLKVAGNTVQAGGDIWGGTIYTDSDLHLANSTITGNTASSTDGRVYGGLSLGTYKTGDTATSRSLTLAASDGKATVIKDNKLGDNSAGIFIGGFGTNYFSEVNAELTIDAQTVSRVELHEDLLVDMAKDVNGAAYTNFTMNIEGNGGDFLWGGKNVIKTGADSAVNFKSGSSTTLLPGYSLTDKTKGCRNLAVNLEDKATLRLTLDLDNNTYASISAQNINFETGSLVTMSEDYYFFHSTSELDMDALTSKPTTVLSLEADPDNLKVESTMGAGQLTVGFQTYDYKLKWDDNKYVQFNLTGGRYDDEVAAAGAAIAPVAISQGVGSQVWHAARNQLQGFFSQNRSFGGPGGLYPPYQTSYGEGDNGLRLWLTPSYGYQRGDSGGGRASFKTRTPGISLGLDKTWDQALLGLSVNAFFPDYESGRTDIDVKDYSALIYGGLRPVALGGLEIMAHLGFGRGDYEQTRQVRGQRLSADYDADNFMAGLELGRRFQFSDHWSLRPFAAYDHLQTKVDGYKERGGDLALSVRSRSHHLNRLSLGAGLGYQDEAGRSVTIEAHYQHLGGDLDPSAQASFLSDPLGARHLSRSTALDENSGGLSLSLKLPVSDNLNFEAALNGTAGPHTQGYDGSLGLSFTW